MVGASASPCLASTDLMFLFSFFFIAIYANVSGFKEISCVVTSLIKIIVSLCEKKMGAPRVFTAVDSPCGERTRRQRSE